MTRIRTPRLHRAHVAALFVSIGRWHRQDQERERKANDKMGCERQCESTHSPCKSGCGSTTGCMRRCQSDAWDCKASCRKQYN